MSEAGGPVRKCLYCCVALVHLCARRCHHIVALMRRLLLLLLGQLEHWPSQRCAMFVAATMSSRLRRHWLCCVGLIACLAARCSRHLMISVQVSHLFRRATDAEVEAPRAAR